jgi:hypothetical protein
MPHITPLNPLLGHERDVDRGSATEDISNLVQRRVGNDQNVGAYPQYTDWSNYQTEGLFPWRTMWQNIWDRDPYSRFFPGIRNEVEDYRQLYPDFTNWTPLTTRMRRGIENALDPYIEKYPWSSYLASQLLPTRSFTHINPFSR